jgi:hypothetical protein
MTIPSVVVEQQDFALGVLPPSGGRLLALVGVSSSGPANVPATFGRTKELIETYGVGPLVEAACHAIERYGRSVVIVRTGQTTEGAYGTLNDDDVAGTSVVTTDATSDPLDDYDAVVEVLLGGTIGTGPISLRWSLDGGRTWSATVSLGTANTYTIPGSQVKFNFAAGTLITGDSWTVRTTAPKWNTAELTAALTALGLTAVEWEVVSIVGDLDSAGFDAVEASMATLIAAAKYRWWIGHTRKPNVAESAATYQTSIIGVFAAKSSTYGALCASAVQLTSSVSGRQYLRPVSFIAAPREAALSEEANSASLKLGAIAAVALRDANGNPVVGLHDETVWPGLDDARFYVLRTWPRRAGVYVNQPRLFSPVGSDFQLVPHRRVMNVALDVLYDYFSLRVNEPIRINASTGFILESEAIAIETEANARLRDALLNRPKASGARCVLSRTDNLLSTSELNGEARVIPLAYPRRIVLSVGFSNPALNVVPVAG